MRVALLRPGLNTIQDRIIAAILNKGSGRLSNVSLKLNILITSSGMKGAMAMTRIKIRSFLLWENFKNNAVTIKYAIAPRNMASGKPVMPRKVKDPPLGIMVATYKITYARIVSKILDSFDMIRV